MTLFRQIEANRRNARLSTGSVSSEGKRRLRYGLTAETVIDGGRRRRSPICLPNVPVPQFQFKLWSDFRMRAAG